MSDALIHLRVQASLKARREALRSLATARGLLEARDPDPDLALYWAFIAGQEAAGKDYVAAKQEAAALGLVPTRLQTFPSVPVRPPARERDMSYEQHVALASMASDRDMLDAQDPDSALYWAFVAGQIGRSIGRVIRAAQERGFLTEGEADYITNAAVAQEALTSARGMLASRDPSSALYWAFVAGQQAAGRTYVDAKREAAALGLVPPYLQDAPTATTEPAE